MSARRPPHPRRNELQARYEDLELRVPPEPVRRPMRRDPDHSGWVIAWLALVLLIAVLIIGAIALAAPRSGQTTDPVDVSGTSSAAHSGAPHEREGGPVSAAEPSPMDRDDGGAPLPAIASTQTGVASWYASRGSGFYAAAPWWHFGDDPVPVAVCRLAEGKVTGCVSLFVTDHCGCYVGTDDERVIDLSRDAFATLADPGVGLIRVQVDIGAQPTLPATDVRP
jgi:hypothetical protein